MRTLAIVGNSTLARSFIKKYQDKFSISTFFRPDYDISDKESCQTLISELNKFDLVVLTAGIMSSDLWETYLTNTVGTNYIAHALYESSQVDRVIVVSSYAGTWTSWPNIEKDRLFYNSSKQAVTNFLMSMSHSGTSNTKVTAFDPSAFVSNMNPSMGMKIDHVIDTLYYLCTLPSGIDVLNIKIKKSQ
jgi:nucleoside-diphosphate-sugar epimerase